MRKLFVCFALLALAGCGSSPKTHFFTLTAQSGQQSAQNLAWPVQVAEVNIPPSLDRREMVTGMSGNTVHLSDQDRWTAPLGDMIRNVLTEDLAGNLTRNRVVLPSAPLPRHGRQIVVSITAFGPQSDGAVRLAGSWSLLAGSPAKPVLSRNIALRTNLSGTGGDAVAKAMSTLLGQLAGRMAADLAQTG